MIDIPGIIIISSTYIFNKKIKKIKKGLADWLADSDGRASERPLRRPFRAAHCASSHCIGSARVSSFQLLRGPGGS